MLFMDISSWLCQERSASLWANFFPQVFRDACSALFTHWKQCCCVAVC